MAWIRFSLVLPTPTPARSGIPLGHAPTRGEPEWNKCEPAQGGLVSRAGSSREAVDRPSLDTASPGKVAGRTVRVERRDCGRGNCERRSWEAAAGPPGS